MAVQRFTYRGFHDGIHRRRAAKISFSLGRHSRLKVACTGSAVLCLTLCGEPESLFRAFVSLLLGHLNLAVYDDRPAGNGKRDILDLPAVCRKG